MFCFWPVRFARAFYAASSAAAATAAASASASASAAASASASASQSARQGGTVSLRTEKLSFRVVVVVVAVLCFFVSFWPLSFAVRVRWGGRLNNIYLIYFYFYFINLIFFN